MLSTGAASQTPLGELTALPSPQSNPLAVFKEPTSKRGREGEGMGRGKEGKVKGREGGGGIWPTQKFWRGAPYDTVVKRSVCEER